MSRAIQAGERWTTFIFDGVDCADMGVYSITDGGTYTTNIGPNFSDQKTTITSYDGQYYYGSQITGQQFVMSMFAEDLSVKELSKLKAWLSPRHLGKIIFSDQPFKYYLVKPVSIGSLANIPLTDIQTPSYSVLGDHVDGNPVYTGKFTITFETVGSAYGYGLSYFRDDLIYDAKDYYGSNIYPDNYYYDSGLLYKDMCPKLRWNIVANANEQPIPMYNPGDAKAYPKFTFTLNNVAPNGSIISFKNKTNGDSIAIDIHGLSGTLTVDLNEESISNGIMSYFGRMTGNSLSLEPKTEAIEIPDMLVEDVEALYLREYDTIHIENSNIGQSSNICTVSINPMAIDVDPDWADGYYLCINYNGGSKINAVNEAENELTLANDVITYDLPSATQQRPGGFECRYRGKYPNTASLNNISNKQPGDVAELNNGDWYIYRYNEWTKTTLFSDRELFKDISGNFVPRYLAFGATVVKPDDVVISTNLSSGFTLSAEILPRYL